MWTFWARLGQNDLKLIFRDPLLAVLSSMALGFALLGRCLLPVLDKSFEANGLMPSTPGGLRFSDTYPLWVSFISLWQGALMPGVILAFLLLDEKEDGTLTAMRVTPVPTSQYLAWRVSLPAALAFLLAITLGPVMGHAPVHLGQLVPLSAGAALAAPIITLLLAHYAHDKVQGFAFTKFAGVAGLVILGGYFVPEPWQWCCGLFPPFLIAKAYWMAHAGTAGWYLPLLLGTGLQVLILRWILSRFAAAQRV